MTEELFTVSFDLRRNYGGRGRDGGLVFAPSGGGAFMSRSCAESLCNVLRPKYANVRVVELTRGDRDEIPAQNLAELGEAVGLERLSIVIQQCANQGFSDEDILNACKTAINKSTAGVARHQRIHELESEAARLRAS